MICRVCGAEKTDNGFIVSGNVSKLWPHDKMYTRVCQYTKKEGCVNTQGSVDNDYVHPLIGNKNEVTDN